MSTKMINRTEIKRNVLHFGFFDNKGRELGYSLLTYEADFVADVAGETGLLSGYTLKPGHYYIVVPHAMKNDEFWGPLQRTQYFETTGARDAWMAKRWHVALKNAEKKAVKA